MATPRHETSADTAARFLEAQQRRRARRDARRAKVTRQRQARLSRLPAAPPERAVPRRIAVDFAEPTLRLIHEMLCDTIAWGDYAGDKLNLLLIGEQMVAVALGDPPCDDPPLTDREAG